MPARRSLMCVPPSPEVMATLFAQYKQATVKTKMTFSQYLASIGFVNPAEADDAAGMDDACQMCRTNTGLELIEVPSQPISGELRIIVLLVDFEDRVGQIPADHYRTLLFSEQMYPTGSMRDYYREASIGKVDIVGDVHGWFRMPQQYAYYTNGESGTRYQSYPRNARRMAEDAVRVALDAGIVFDPSLDKLGKGVVTALFVVHAGRGAEMLHPAIRGGEIWSHKWTLPNPVDLGNGLFAAVYLTVPEDCRIGVCAHELGHLAFQWQDFYDPNYNEDGTEWDGSGQWDLMAGGSYNGDSLRPAHPACLHKSQHGWITVDTLNASKQGLVIPPYTSESGKIIKVKSARFGPKQYLLLENRHRVGFDDHLPGEGLLVWRVDEAGEQESPNTPGLLLIQADGQHDLENAADWNSGDASDPFPGVKGITRLVDTGDVLTSFPDAQRSGVTLSDIAVDPETKEVSLNVTIS